MESNPQSLRWNAFLLSLYALLIVIGFAPFQYAIDPDGTSYLALAHRWTAGDYARAVNGYWSPWSIWLTAGGLRLGLSESVAAIGQFAMGGGLFLILGIRLIREQNIAAATLKIIEICLVVFTVYTVYIQWFNDVWAAAFALWGIQILMRTQETKFYFARSFWYGFSIALAYYSKAYYLPFFVLITLFWALKCPTMPLLKRLLFVGSTALVAILCCLPWWVALYHKYRFFTTGTAGPLNLSWGLLGHPIFPKGVQLLPPPYPNSPSSWEDPWYYNATLAHFWDSPQMAVRQLLRCGYFALRLLLNAALLSLPAIAILLQNGVQFGSRLFKKETHPGPFLTSATLALFPLGLLFVHSEARYLWPLVPFFFVWIASQKKGFFYRYRKYVLVTGALGLLLQPAYRLPQIGNAGRWEKSFGEALRRQNIKGGFATAGPAAPNYAECLRVAHFSGLSYWPPAGPVIPLKEIGAAAKKAGVGYLLLSPQLPLPAGASVIYKSKKGQFVRLPAAP